MEKTSVDIGNSINHRKDTESSKIEELKNHFSRFVSQRKSIFFQTPCDTSVQFFPGTKEVNTNYQQPKYDTVTQTIEPKPTPIME